MRNGEPSEEQLQGQLNGSRSAYLIERVEAAETGRPSKRIGQRLCGKAELRVDRLRTLEVSDGRTEVGVIQDIEHLCPELQLKRLMDGKVPMYGEVPLSSTESAESISPKIPLSGRVAVGICWRRRECSRIKRLSARILPSK